MLRSRGVIGWTAAVAMLTAPARGMAQEVTELPGEDRQINANFEEVFRIGSFEGETWETFGEIAGTAFDAAGNLYVFDRQASRITMVDRNGEFVREIGQPGEGPGEFRMPMQFAAMPDGRLVVADMGHRSYQLFGPDGAYQRMVSMGGPDEIRIGEFSPDPTGDAIIMGGSGSVVAMRSGPGGAGAPPQTRPIDRVSLAGDMVDVTTMVEGWQPPRSDEPQTLEGGGMAFRVNVAGPRTFEPGLLVGVLPDGGVAFADSSTYTIKVTDVDGNVTRVLRRPFTPRPVTSRMQDAERERRLEELEAGEGPRVRIMATDGSGGGARAISQDAVKEMMRGQIEQMQFYPELPVLLGLQTSWGGNIWAQRRGDAPTDPGPIDVLTPQGRYVGTFSAEATEMPSSFGPDGLAAYVESDEFEVPVVVVRRLPTTVN